MNKKNNRVRRQLRKAFSLMEMMVVLVIIGLLSAAVSVGIRNAMWDARLTTAKGEIGKFADALELFNGKTGKYPTQDEGLEVLFKPIDGAEGGILTNNLTLEDPWGNKYLYVLTNQKGAPYEVICVGGDGIEGTDDDLSNIAKNE